VPGKSLCAALALALLALACGVGQTITPAPTLTAPVATLLSHGRCGDGVCDGPAVGGSPAAGVPPLYFFYAIHTHASGDHLPYDDLGMVNVNPQVADNMIAAIEGIAGVMDRYGVKGTWEVVYGTASGLCAYEGENHVFGRLQAGGHEVGAHAHRIQDVDVVFQALRDDCGIVPRTTSGFIVQISSVSPQETMSLAIEIPVDLGMTAGTSNLSPGGGKNPFGSLCNNYLGVGNDICGSRAAT
jgi:hypothetical protein